MKKVFKIFGMVVLATLLFASCNKQCELKPKSGYYIVGEDKDCYYKPSTTAPTASFTFSVNGHTVFFTNTSTDATSYYWDFGDGYTSENEKNPSHYYLEKGTYTVSLTATNDAGSSTVSQKVTISSSIGQDAVLKLTNISSHPFKVYIDNVFKSTVYGGSSYSYSDDAGQYSIKIEQSSGYYQYPLTQTFNKSIYAGQTTAFDIPTITTGTIKLISQSDNPYSVYINDVSKGTIEGNSTKTYEVDAWHSYNVRVLQQSGYVLYPSEYTWTINVDANYTSTKTFPY